MGLRFEGAAGEAPLLMSIAGKQLLLFFMLMDDNLEAMLKEDFFIR